MKIPDGFEEVMDAPKGALPHGFEEVPQKSEYDPSALDLVASPSNMFDAAAGGLAGLFGAHEDRDALFKRIQERSKQQADASFGANAKGSGTAILDTIGGIPGAIVGGAAGLLQAPFAGPQAGLKTAKDVMNTLTPSTLLGIDVKGNPAYDNNMLPVTIMSEGMQKAGQGYAEIAKAGGADPATAAKIAAATELGLLGSGAAGGAKSYGKKALGALSEFRDRGIKEPVLPPDVPPIPEGFEQVWPEGFTGNTPMERQLNGGKAMEAREQAFADQHNIQGELDLRPPDMPLDENGMPHNPELSLDAQEAGGQGQPDMFPVDESPRSHTEEPPARQEAALPDVPEQTAPTGGVPRGQRGGINVDAIGEAINNLKEKFKDFSVSVDKQALGFGQREPNSVVVKMTDSGGKLVGLVDFAIRPDGVLTAENAQVASSLRGKGAAARMYAAAREAGHDIAPGKVQTDLGNKMVESLQRQGLINKEAEGTRFKAGDLNLQPLQGESLPGSRYVRSPGGRQAGALNFGGIEEGLKKMFGGKAGPEAPKVVRNIVGEHRIPQDGPYQPVLEKALAEGKDGKGINNLESGIVLAAMTRKSAFLDYVGKTMHNALNRSDMFAKEKVDPVQTALRKTSKKELVNLSKLMQWEDRNGRLLTAEELSNSGVTEKVMKAYTGLREMREHSLQIQNERRAAAGMEPIESREHGLASRWTGAFKQAIYANVLDEAGNPKWDKNGQPQKKLVYMLAADTKIGLRMQVDALKKQHPEFEYNPKHQFTSDFNGGKKDIQALYSTMLDLLGRDDPAVAKLEAAYEAALEAEGRTVAGAQKHFEPKAGIRGYVGDRPGKNPGKEAMAMFQQQLQQARNAYKWASMQEAVQKLKPLLSDERLQEQQPNNVSYARDYLSNAMGHGTAQWVKAIESAFRATGVDMSVISRIVGGSKSFFILQKIGASTGFVASNIIQALNAIPHLVDQQIKAGANPIKSIATALYNAPLSMGSGIVKGTYTAANHLTSKVGASLPSSPFYKEAMSFAEDNGIIGQNEMTDAPINKRGPVTAGINAYGATMTAPELWVRSSAYMAFVDMLKSTGQYKTNAEIFQKAGELVRASMVDYGQSETPLLFPKLGVAGKVLSTLQKYPMNFYNQYRYFGKEALRGNPAPLMTMMAIQYAVAGMAGIPGFQDLDKLWGWAKSKLPDNQWAKVKDFDPKLWMLEHLGESSVYGALSTHTGLNLTGRMSAPGFGDMMQAPGGPLIDQLKQGGTAVGALLNPTNSTKRAQAVHDLAPSGLQGYLETGPMKEHFAVMGKDADGQKQFIKGEGGTQLYKKSSDLEKRDGQYARTPFEEKVRAFGMRSQREAMSNEVLYKTKEMDKQVTDRSKGLVEKYWDAVQQGDDKRVADIQKLYVSINGKAISDQTTAAQLMQEYTSALTKQALSAKERLEALKGLARVQEIMKKHDETYGGTTQ